MFRFTIRELVLLTLVVAMGVAWWVDRTRLAAALDSVTAVAEALIEKDQFTKFMLRHRRLPPD